MTDGPTEPSKEALEVALSTLADENHGFGPKARSIDVVARHVALALDRFRAAGVREERERCVRIASEVACQPVEGYNAANAWGRATARILKRIGASP